MEPMNQSNGDKNARFGFWREPFSAASHLVGCILAIALLPLLLLVAGGRVPHTIGALAFGGGLITLYGASAFFHGLVAPPHHIARLEKFDHIAIFLLIVGTYAPLCLVKLWGPVGWWMLGLEIGLGLLGIVLVAQRRDAHEKHRHIHEGVRLSLYLIMGWLAVFFAGPVFNSLTPGGAFWLVAGGVAYSLGAIIFATDRPHLWPGKFNAHDLWHLFVLAGSLAHLTFVMGYVIRQ